MLVWDRSGAALQIGSFWTSILKLKQPQLRCGALKGPTHSGEARHSAKILKGLELMLEAEGWVVPVWHRKCLLLQKLFVLDLSSKA